MTLEEKIANANKVEMYYKPPHKTKYAVVEYYARQGKPLRVESYYIFGEELKTGELLKCWNSDILSTNFCVKEDNFETEMEAIVRMKEIKAERSKKMP